MASSEDFRKYIQAGKLTEALALAMSSAVKLQITTRVLGDEDMATGNESQSGERIRTQINMVEGQITNEIGEQFTGKNPYKDLKQVHLAQVKEGPKTIQSNLKSLQKLFRLLAAMRQQNLLDAAPIDVTPSAELSSGLEQGILLPPMGGYEATGQEVVSTPAVNNADAQNLAAIPIPDSSIDYSPHDHASTPEDAAANLESDPELDPEKNKIDPLVKYGLIAAAGAATVAVVAGITNAFQEKRSVEHESLAELEPDLADGLDSDQEPEYKTEYKTDDKPDYKYDDDSDDLNSGDATVIQLSTVAYSSSATYVPVPSSIPPDNSETSAANAQTGNAQTVDSPDNNSEVVADFSQEDWDDFGENLPVETLSQVPHNPEELMAATLEATQPEPVAPRNEDLLDEDWDDLEMSPLSATELSSFADAQEAAWEEEWEEDPEEARSFSRPMPPAPPIVMGYPIDSPGGLEAIDTTDDQGWDDMEEEFKYISSPTGRLSGYGHDVDDDGDDEFEMIDNPENSSGSDHNSLAAASDSMEDIFGDLDDSLLLSHGSTAESAVDDFANFDLDEEFPSSYH